MPLESAFSWMKHELPAQYPSFKGPDALGKDLNLKQIWISPAVRVVTETAPEGEIQPEDAACSMPSPPVNSPPPTLLHGALSLSAECKASREVKQERDTHMDPA